MVNKYYFIFIFNFFIASKDDVIESQSKASESQSCKFGELNLKLGDTLKSKNQNKCLKCKCSIPPFITCIESC